MDAVEDRRNAVQNKSKSMIMNMITNMAAVEVITTIIIMNTMHQNNMITKNIMFKLMNIIIMK